MPASIALIVAGVLGGVALLVVYLNRPLTITLAAPLQDDSPDSGFPHDRFESLLRKYVAADGHANYADWHRSTSDRSELAGYLAAVSRYSPENAPERFPTRNDELAYWIYGYNAWVIHSILERWPLESVTAVRAPLEIVTGFGFFYRLRFPFGDRPYSLYKVENDKIRKEFRDARIHFLLNCGSESCPVLRATLPAGTELEAMLQQAATDFVSDERNVRIDAARQEIALSAIFKWYEKDFLNDLRRQGLPVDSGIAGYVASVAPEALRRQLAQCQDCAVVFNDYDWSVNAVLAE